MAPRLIPKQIDTGLLGETAIDGNDDWLYYIKNHHLFRFKVDELNDENVTPRELPVELDNRTGSLWIGPDTGLLLADDPDRPLQIYILDGLSQKPVKNLPEINGKILAADVSFSENTTWLTLETQEYDRTLKYLFAINSKTRELLAWLKASELYIPTWLDRIDHKAAYEEMGESYLLCPTEAGAVRLKVVSNRIMEAGMDTKIRLAADGTFFAHKGEITVVTNQAYTTPTLEAPTPHDLPSAATELNTPFVEAFDFKPDAFLKEMHNKNQEINSKRNNA